ncbi:MAG: WXG100 family type VII secretion target [Oscillospiraceae bacterium]|nr:WXG100 family type VII secretion target [Oscillospiraceae bacterium]
MANQIRITPDQMRTRAAEYTRQANAVQDVINNMDRLLNQLKSEWEGNASNAYADRFQQLRPSFVNAKNLIDEISAALKATAQTLEETDNSIANQFRG